MLANAAAVNPRRMAHPWNPRPNSSTRMAHKPGPKYRAAPGRANPRPNSTTACPDCKPLQATTEPPHGLTPSYGWPAYQPQPPCISGNSPSQHRPHGEPPQNTMDPCARAHGDPPTLKLFARRACGDRPPSQAPSMLATSPNTRMDPMQQAPKDPMHDHQTIPEPRSKTSPDQPTPAVQCAATETRQRCHPPRPGRGPLR
jgi:hypothetical protein